MKIVRATETWQQAGAYYVRIQAMAKQYHITLREEFDEHDGPDTNYIVLLDKEFPVATCRIYEIDKNSVMIGRVVVLPEYRNQGLGSRVIGEAEAWIKEQNYKKIVLESRDVAVEFYKKLGYAIVSDHMIHGETFSCIRMEKELEPYSMPQIDRINFT